MTPKRLNSKKPIIALDCDGVLLDYNLAYAKVWERFTGVNPTEVNPMAYWHTDRWNVKRLMGEHLDHLHVLFGEDFWATIPPIPGAVDASQGQINRQIIRRHQELGVP